MIAPELIALLEYLLPGFVAAWIFHGLTAHPRRSQFERIVHALILLLFVLAGVAVVKAFLLFFGRWVHFGQWTEDAHLVTSVFVSVGVGVAFSFATNSDCIHEKLRKWKVTRETSRPSNWYEAFCTHNDYVVLHMHDGRRLWGWPRAWPSDPQGGHFVVNQPTWLVDSGAMPITGVEALLIASTEVRWVEFLERGWGRGQQNEEVESATADAEPVGYTNA